MSTHAWWTRRRQQLPPPCLFARNMDEAPSSHACPPLSGLGLSATETKFDSIPSFSLIAALDLPALHAAIRYGSRTPAEFSHQIGRGHGEAQPHRQRDDDVAPEPGLLIGSREEITPGQPASVGSLTSFCWARTAHHSLSAQPKQEPATSFCWAWSACRGSMIHTSSRRNLLSASRLIIGEGHHPSTPSPPS
jgi:hypothetical protein